MDATRYFRNAVVQKECNPIRRRTTAVAALRSTGLDVALDVYPTKVPPPGLSVVGHRS